MGRCCRIFYLAISAPKLSECTQYECTGVAAFFSWSILHPKFQTVPNVNALVLLHLLAGHFCAQIPRVHPMCMRRCCCIFYLAIYVPKMSECAQCERTGVAAFFTWPFLHSNCHSGPNLNALVLPHFLVGYFCTQTFRVGLI